MTETEPSSPVLRCRRVSKRFAGGVVAVDDVTLDIGRNAFFALLGPSGCGKTTLLRLLGGFETPTAGTIELDGQDMTGVPPNRRPVNMVFQSYAVFPHMSVGDNVAYGLKVAGVPRAERDRRVQEALDMVRLGDFAHRRPDEISGGQRQRVALARALVKRPKVLLLDEPLSALDRKLREEMRLELVRLRHALGITFVFVTHDQEEAMSMADRIGVMDRGRIVQVGTPDAIYEHPESRFVADFVGDINLFEARVADRNGTLLRLASPEAGADLLVENGAGPEPGTAVALGVRPEKIAIDGAAPDMANVVVGMVLEIAYLGERSVVHVRTDSGKIVKVSLPNDRRGDGRAPGPGAAVRLSWAPSNGILLPA